MANGGTRRDKIQPKQTKMLESLCPRGISWPWKSPTSTNELGPIVNHSIKLKHWASYGPMANGEPDAIKSNPNRQKCPTVTNWMSATNLWIFGTFGTFMPQKSNNWNLTWKHVAKLLVTWKALLLTDLEPC